MTPDARRSVRIFSCSAIWWWQLVVRLGRSADSGSQVRLRRKFGETFPFGTLLVNISGSLIIGFFAALTGPDGRIWSSPSVRQFFMIGVLGGYTTFSSFSLQTLALARDGEWLFAALNAIGSFVLCLFAVWLGDHLAVLLNQR
jgi:CrcB protein